MSELRQSQGSRLPLIHRPENFCQKGSLRDPSFALGITKFPCKTIGTKKCTSDLGARVIDATSHGKGGYLSDSSRTLDISSSAALCSKAIFYLCHRDCSL